VAVYETRAEPDDDVLDVAGSATAQAAMAGIVG